MNEEFECPCGMNDITREDVEECDGCCPVCDEPIEFENADEDYAIAA